MSAPGPCLGAHAYLVGGKFGFDGQNNIEESGVEEEQYQREAFEYLLHGDGPNYEGGE